jgi:hypothetical protein
MEGSGAGHAVNAPIPQPHSTPRPAPPHPAQDQVTTLYHKGMAGPEKAIRKRANISGVGFGFSQAVFFCELAFVSVFVCVCVCVCMCVCEGVGVGEGQ